MKHRTSLKQCSAINFDLCTITVLTIAMIEGVVEIDWESLRYNATLARFEASVIFETRFMNTKPEKIWLPYELVVDSFNRFINSNKRI